MKRVLKWIGLVVGVLVLAVVVFAVWLLEAESGARFALERAKSALADKLTVEQSRGALVSPLTLEGLHYRDAESGIDVRVKSVKVDYSLSGLFSRTLHVNHLDVDGVDVAMTTVPTAVPAAPAPSLQSLLTPPLAILLDQASITHIAVAQDGKPVFVADRFDLGATWTAAALTIQKLALRAPDGSVDLVGGVSSYADYRGSAKGSFDWKLQDQRATGTLDVHNDGNSATIALQLSQPMLATVDGTIASRDKNLPWMATIHVPTFDPRKLAGSDALQSLGVDLSGAGDRAHGKVNATLQLNTHTVALDPLQYELSGNTLSLDTVRLHSPEARGVLTAKGKAQLDANPISADVDADWADVELPADLVGQALATHGTLRASGSAAKFAANGDLAIGPPGQLSNISFALDGTQQLIELHRLALKQPKGDLDVTGNVHLQPQVQWDLKATANHFDPGAFAKEWPGSIDLSLSTMGKVEKEGPAGELKIDKLGGTLRQRPLVGQGDITFASPLAVNGTLDLKSGNSSIDLKGKTAEHTDITANLAIASLGDWLPSAAGSLRGTIGLKGKWPDLDAQVHLDAAKLASGEVHVDSVAVNVDVHDLKAPSGTLNVTAQDLVGGNYTFDTIKLDGRGDQSAHTVSLDARGPQLSASMAVTGALTHPAKDLTGWQGSLTALSLAPKDGGTWKLTKPAPISYGKDTSFGDLCLGADNASICVSATQTADESLQAKFVIAHLQLKTIARFADPESPLRLDGEINGGGSVARSGAGALSGGADISSVTGSIAYPDSQSQPLVAYKDFAVTAKLDANQSTIDVKSGFADSGRLDGHIVIGANGADGAPLSGNINASLGNLGIVDLLNTQTASTRGKIDAKIALSGSTSKPGVAGDVALAGFATEIPAAGLKLHDGDIKLHSDNGSAFDINGVMGSDNGKLNVSGTLGVDKNSPLQIKVSGDNFMAADIPGARVHISPDITLTRKGNQFVVNGTVTVPKADVDLSKLPGGGIAQTSPDVVITDEKTSANETSAPIVADITVKFGAGEKLDLDLRQGQEVHLVGFGLNGYLSGQLAVQDVPGRATTGRGQIVVDGTYKAYGQDLTIQQGRLLFAGTPVDNPGLDLRATRAFTDPDVTVGLQVRGTAQVPILTVFSDPAMEQSDALSYLVAGKPLNQLKSGEGDAVGSAARALGTAGGDLLAKSVGRKVGLDDVGVADNTAVGGAALTIGKYLSPRLYLSYGVGLFTPGEVVTLRYRLTRLFNIEIQNGTLSSRAGINYKIEK
jgi:translocation and assembly module TamB